MIILVGGLARSGKDAVANHIAKKYGFIKRDYSTEVLVFELKKRGLAVNKKNMSVLADKLREQEGWNVLAKKLFEKFDNWNGNIVISGNRSIEETGFWKKKFDNVKVIAVNADKKTRLARKQEMDPKTLEEFFARDERDRKKGIYKVIEKADHIIENNGSINELKQKIDDLMKKFKY